MSLLIEGIKSEGSSPTKHAAMYYKTEPFVSGIGNYSHTNNWEIQKAIEIICNKGFSVDLIDRSNNNWRPNKKYDLFLGLGVGNTGDKFARYAKASKAEKRVLLAMGPQPDISNERTIGRYEMFNQRTGQNAPPMRTVTRVLGPVFDEIIDHTDYIVCIGEEGTESYNSFLQYKKPILTFYPGVSDKVTYNTNWLDSRNKDHFLCFAGNGLICKGVDLVVEAFMNQSKKFLHICGPMEPAFLKQYGKMINDSKNIYYHGFIEPGGNKFNKIASLCAYTVFHSASESCCTSVATTMKAGLVPIVNSWTGILIEDGFNGINIPDTGDIISHIKEKTDYASNMDDKTYENLVLNNNKRSKVFSQEGFSDSYEKAINKILDNRI